VTVATTSVGTGGPPGNGAQAKESRPVAPILLFIAGFATIFTALGAFTSTFGPILRSSLGLRIAGIFVLAFGAYMILYALRLGGTWLFVERRPFLDKVKPGKGTAYPLGMAFATGFTPCIGPVLAGILGIAAAQGGGAWGATLMLSYSLGLGLPFLLLGLGVQRLMGTLGWVKRNFHWIAAVSGTIMIFIGFLLVLNLWNLFLARTGLLNLINGFEPPI
jgi:cytochrome c-type biogenesis protein